MFCGKCGTEVRDGAQFCHGCGAPMENAKPVKGKSGGAYAKPKKSPKVPKALIIGIAAAAVLVLVISLFAGIFGGPTVTVTKALAKSAGAVTSALKDTQLTEAADLLTKKEVSQTVGFWLEDMPDMSELNGLGVRMNVDASLSDKKLGMNITPYFGSADLVNLQLKLDNDKLYAGSPQLTGDKFYMINTASMGKDLAALTGEEELEALSLNLFALIDELEKISKENSETMKKDMEKAVKTFVKSIEVEKIGSETVEVNDQDLKCTAYEVVLTEKALDQLVKDVQKAYESMDNTKAVEALVEALGLPEEAMDEMEYALEDSASEMEAVFEDLRDAVEELGDLELQLYINKGYVVAVVYEAEIEGSDLEIALNIGGNKNYLDDISLRMTVDDNELTIVSSGNHTGKGGEFTDETVVKMKEYGERKTVAQMELRYAPKADSDNFAWSLEADGEELSAEGLVKCDSKGLNIKLDEVAFEDEFCIGLEYSLTSYAGDTIKTKNCVSLNGMTEDELMEEMNSINQYATAWAEQLLADFPDLIYYLF